MREILFRGYSKEDNQWHYGYIKPSAYLNEKGEIEKYSIIQKRSDETRAVWWLEEYDIDKDSIGQYTGFQDKNGKKIFERDVLQWDIDYYGYAEMISGRWIILPEAISSEDYYIDELANKVEIIGNVYEERLRKEKYNA